MGKTLVIVESPAKARTIAKFLGSSFNVLSSQGHIRDIESIGRKSIGIDFENNYAPNYQISADKKAIVDRLKKEAKTADKILLASDEDREGEAIAWHLKEVLDLNDKNTQRIVFHEITKNAILKAIETPRNIDYNLVNAQQARRVMDRIVGFELSPVLWKKVATGLSAGRVQSVAVRLIVDRENEIKAFKSEATYRVVADLMANDAKKTVIHTELNHRFETKEEAMAFLELCKQNDFTISSITKKPGKRTPAPPFTTSSLQQEAARKLGFPVAKTMRIAQRLYEDGKITYMRTDSVLLSTLALGLAKDEICKTFGENYSKPRQYTTVSKGAQEAHEAIRPTQLQNNKIDGTRDEQRLYELIWKRTMASQMSDANIETTKFEINVKNSPYQFIASGEIITFDGFMKLYVQSKDDEINEKDEKGSILPNLKEKDTLSYVECVAQQSYTKAPARYTEASLVKKMEELGIGRPSTYATIIETILSRKYVEEKDLEGSERTNEWVVLKGGKITTQQKKEKIGAEKHKLCPTDTGFLVTEFLIEHFPAVMNYDFTAKEEANFDDIAVGKKQWVKVVDEFYKPFHKSIDTVPAGRSASRLLGNDPQTGEPIYVKITRMGVCVQRGEADKDKKPKFVNLKEGQSYYSITLQEALELLAVSFPYELGKYEDKDILVCSGRFGPFLNCGGKFYTIPKTIDPRQITMDEAIDLIQKKEQQSIPIKDFGEIKVLNGRYGAYIKYNDGNYKIPKGTVVETLDEKQCKAIIESSSPTNQKAKFVRKARRAATK